MAKANETGRPIPTLVLVLLASFVLMLLSGVFYGLGLPEDWARGLFMVTVVLWFILGGALMVNSFIETREYGRKAQPTPAPSKKEAAEDDD
jgi:Na+/melibiose symporter-like transporter